LKQYNVFLEIFGKKVRMTVTASSQEEANQLAIAKTISNIKFHKTVEAGEAGKSDDDMAGQLKEIMELFEMLSFIRNLRKPASSR
jgi:hypothetical protein